MRPHWSYICFTPGEEKCPEEEGGVEVGEAEAHRPFHLGKLAEVGKLVLEPHNDATSGSKPSLNGHSP